MEKNVHKLGSTHTILKKFESRCFDVEGKLMKLVRLNAALKQTITSLEDGHQKIKDSIQSTI